MQPDLARTLTRIRDRGAKDFYEGETAELLAADMKEHGGLITLEKVNVIAYRHHATAEGRTEGRNEGVPIHMTGSNPIT